MLAFDLVIALAAMSQAPEAPQAPPAPAAELQSQVEVVAPTPRRVCRMVQQRGSHLAARRVCETPQERESAIEQSQREIGESIDSTNSRQFADRWQPSDERSVPMGNEVPVRDRGNIRTCGMRGPC